MIEIETARLLEMRIQARQEPVLLAQIDRALWVIAQLEAADDDDDLTDLEVAVEELALLVGTPAIRH